LSLEEKGEVIPLDGFWDFYWNQSFKTYESSTKQEIPVPGSWHPIHPLSGICVYKLRILATEPNEIYGLKIYEFPQTYRIYVNGKMMHQNGVFSEDINVIQRSLVRPILFFTLEKSENTIIIEAANNREIRPGPRKSMIFGKYQDILSIETKQLFTDLVSLGILGIMSLYHFALFFQRRKENGSLIFAIFCLIMFFRVLVTEEHYLLKIFENFPANLEWYFDVGSFLVLSPVLGFLFYFNFPQFFKKKYLRLILAFFLIFSGLYFVTANEFVFNLLLVASFISGFFYFSVLLRAVFSKSPGAKIFLIGWLVFLITSAFDMLAYSQIFRSNYISHLGFIFYIFSQSYYLSIRFNKALQYSEELSESLEQKVSERTKMLNESLQLITADLGVAKKLQETLILSQKKDFAGFDLDYLYIPQSEVGGDFFDFRELSPYKYRLFLADATGHGVQAAMVTMIIKSECDRLLTMDIPFEKIMSEINNVFMNKYLSSRILFTAVLVEFDLGENKIKLASAGHPAQCLIRNSSLESIKPKGQIIGIQYTNSYSFVERAFEVGDKLCLFSDGAYEDLNPSQEMYGEERWEQSLKEHSHLSPKEMLKKVWDQRQSFIQKNSFDDDCTVFIIERR